MATKEKPKQHRRGAMPTATNEQIEEWLKHRYVGKHEAALILGCHADTVCVKAREGKLNVRCSKPGGQWIFNVQDLLALADGQL